MFSPSFGNLQQIVIKPGTRTPPPTRWQV